MFRRIAALVLIGATAFAADQPTTPITLTTLIKAVIDAAVPSTAELISKLWGSHKATGKISRDDLEKKVAEVNQQNRKDAVAKIQPISEISAQLTAVTTLVNSADTANEQLLMIAGRMSAAQLSDSDWADAKTAFAAAKPGLKKLEEFSDERLSPIRDASIRVFVMQLRDVATRTQPYIDADLGAKSKERLAAHVGTLSAILSQVHIVSSAQVALLNLDLAQVSAWANGKGPVRLPENNDLRQLQDQLKRFLASVQAQP